MSTVMSDTKRVICDGNLSESAWKLRIVIRR